MLWIIFIKLIDCVHGRPDKIIPIDNDKTDSYYIDCDNGR